MYYACAVWSVVWKRRLPDRYLIPNYGCLYAICIAQLLVLCKIKIFTVQWLLYSMKNIVSYYNFNSINVK